MKTFIFSFLLFLLLPVSVRGEEFSAPLPPENAEILMPEQQQSFGKDLWKITVNAVGALRPEIRKAVKICVCLTAVSVLVSMLRTLPGRSADTAELAGTISAAVLLTGCSDALISLGIQTVREISEYGRLLLPVITAAMAAQGGITSSGALYAGTAIFDTLLSAGISRILVPLIYLFIAVSIGSGVLKEDMLKRIQAFLKWIITWSLKITLYLFTGYMGITGVVSGSVDAAAIKAAKLTMSGMVPVVGGILSDASESVLVGAEIMKNSVGIYGMLVIFAIWISPFLQIGIQYLMLKVTAALCQTMGTEKIAELTGAFSAAMGLLLAMTSALCTMLLISMICFMKGMG